MEFIILVVALVVSFITGSIVEKQHFSSLRQRESKARRQPIVSHEQLPKDKKILHSSMVSGSSVVAAEYFKSFTAGLRGLIGGSVSSYESLLDRARREAVLRMRERSPSCDVIVNIRIETTQLGREMVEAVAYGTAVTFVPDASDILNK